MSIESGEANSVDWEAKATRANSIEDWEVEVTFVPGERLGMQFETDTGLVTDVTQDGQADRKGVKLDWIMVQINGEDYSYEAFEEAATGDRPYIIIFDDPDG